MTGILSASSGHAVRRNAALLPAYTFVLGLIALLGFFALAAGVDKLPEFAEGFKQFKANFAVPALMLHSFPAWFAGVTFAAIGIGALVPAAIMSIAAANLFTRNIYREFLHGTCSDKQEAQMAKWVSLIVKLGALVFIVFVPLQYAIQLQLLGGIWIIQTLPAVLIGLYTRWFNPWALLIGWAVGMRGRDLDGVVGQLRRGLPAAVGDWTFPGYTALYTLILNLVIAIVLTPVMNAIGAKHADKHRGRRLLRLTAGRSRAPLPALACSTCVAAGALPSAAASMSPRLRVPPRCAMRVCSAADHLQRHVDIVARRVGVGTDLFVRLLRERCELRLRQALVLDMELYREAEAAALARPDRDRAHRSSPCSHPSCAACRRNRARRRSRRRSPPRTDAPASPSPACPGRPSPSEPRGPRWTMPSDDSVWPLRPPVAVAVAV